jgi:hypothetical protein
MRAGGYHHLVVDRLSQRPTMCPAVALEVGCCLQVADRSHGATEEFAAIGLQDPSCTP